MIVLLTVRHLTNNHSQFVRPPSRFPIRSVTFIDDHIYGVIILICGKDFSYLQYRTSIKCNLSRKLNQYRSALGVCLYEKLG